MMAPARDSHLELQMLAAGHWRTEQRFAMPEREAAIAACNRLAAAHGVDTVRVVQESFDPDSGLFRTRQVHPRPRRLMAGRPAGDRTAAPAPALIAPATLTPPPAAGPGRDQPSRPWLPDWLLTETETAAARNSRRRSLRAVRDGIMAVLMRHTLATLAAGAVTYQLAREGLLSSGPASLAVIALANGLTALMAALYRRRQAGPAAAAAPAAMAQPASDRPSRQTVAGGASGLPLQAAGRLAGALPLCTTLAQSVTLARGRLSAADFAVLAPYWPDYLAAAFDRYGTRLNWPVATADALRDSLLGTLDGAKADGVTVDGAAIDDAAPAVTLRRDALAARLAELGRQTADRILAGSADAELILVHALIRQPPNPAAPTT